MSVKRYTADGENATMVEDDRSMEYEAVRRDSYVLAVDYNALEAELANGFELHRLSLCSRITALEAELADYKAKGAETIILAGREVVKAKQRIAELEAELAAINNDVAGVELDKDDVPPSFILANIIKLKERNRELETALRKYGRHLGDGTMGGMCEAAYDALALGPCTCGLDAALGNSDEQ